MMDVPNTNISFGMEASALDMLAEVASATLKSDPSLSCNKKKKIKCQTSKVHGNTHSRKNSGSDKLTLDQIKVLSDKMRIDMFSELICDEMTRNYSFKCFLMPDKCSQTFKSFGSEARARCKMRSHLQSHINDLDSEYNDTIFTAEPLHIRRKRLQELNVKSQRKKKRGRLPNTKRKSDSSEEKYFNDDMDDFNFASSNAFQKPHNSPSSNFNCDFPKYTAIDTHQNVEDSGHLSGYHQKSLNIKQEYNFDNYNEDQSSKIASPDNLNVKLHTRKKSKKQSIVSSSTQASYTVKWDIDFDEVALNNSSQLNFNMQKTFPHPSVSFHHDHTYTTIHGNTYYDVLSEDLTYHTVVKPVKEDKNSQIFTTTFKPLVIPTPPFPYIYSPMLPHIAEIKEVKVNSYSACSSNDYLRSYQASAVALPIKKPLVKDLKNFELNDFSPSEDDEAITEDDENTDSYLDDVISDNETYSETDSGTMLNSSFIVDDDVLETDCPANLQSVEKVQ